MQKKICECLRARLGRSWQIRTFFIGVLVSDFWGAYNSVGRQKSRQAAEGLWKNKKRTARRTATV